MGEIEIWVMWDGPLYAVNMFYYHWLIKKLLWADCRIEQGRNSMQRQRRKEAGVRETPCNC